MPASVERDPVLSFAEVSAMYGVDDRIYDRFGPYANTITRGTDSAAWDGDGAPGGPDVDGDGDPSGPDLDGDVCIGAGWDPQEPPEPDWALEASQQVLKERLAAAAQDRAGLEAAAVLEALTPDIAGGPDPAVATRMGHGGMDAACLIHGIRAAQRLINHYQAVQQQWIAAMARPGVAVPLPDLVNACQHPARRIPGALRPPRDLPDDLPVDTDGEVDYSPLLTNPAWAAALADTAARLASAEIGCALHMAPITARMRTETALAMADSLPATLAAQHAGDLDGYRAAIIADRTTVLTRPQRRSLEQRILPSAASRTPSALRDQIDREVIAVDPDAAERRARHARTGRGVRVDKDLDDMAVFRARLGCGDAQLAYGVLDDQATALTAAGLADGRGSDQLRADIFSDLFRRLATTGHAHLATSTDGQTPSDTPTGHDTPAGHTATGNGQPPSDTPAGQAHPTGHTNGSAAGSGPESHTPTGPVRRPHPTGRNGRRTGQVAGVRRRGCLNVYISAATLAGFDDAPAELAGYGTITADTARAIAASADTVRALVTRPASTPTDCETTARPGNGRAVTDSGHSANPARNHACGTILDAGRTVYRPPDATMDYVTARDRTCTWPGCRARGKRCDADHRHSWHDGGATCPCNLDLLCRFHHQVRTFTAWRSEPGPDGILIWTSPAGNTYPSEPGHPLLDATAGTGPPGDRWPDPHRENDERDWHRETAEPDDDPPPF